MIEQSPTVNKLFAALVAAQAEMRNPPKDSVNPHFKSKFADLATVLDTVKPVLAKHKLGVVQLPCEVAGIGPGLSTMLVHESGEFIRGVIALRPVKPDPQGIGSAMTYARRYGLQAVLGITADDDDDGNHASKPQQQSAKPTTPAANGKPKARPAATVTELWTRMGNKEPANGADLLASLAQVDGALARLLGGEYTPGGLADAVREFSRVRDAADLGGLTGDPLAAAWANGKQYVKRIADQTAAVNGGAK